MDFNNFQPKNCEIEQFLRDVREHFKASLASSEYENSSNLFHVTEAEATAKLLQRCEILLQKSENNHNSQEQSIISSQSSLSNPETLVIGQKPTAIKGASELDASYLDMTGNYSKKKSASHEHLSPGSDQTHRYSTSLADICDGRTSINASNSIVYQTINKSLKDSLSSYAHELFKDKEDLEIYDTCVVSQYSLTALETASSCDDCPFMNLPASHLATHKSSKFGQLQRIEKRLFFDQCKKCFCGILNDWLLCYADHNACRPNSFLYLKTPAIQIEHFGEGKRRDVCFQITTGDPSNDKMIFQASNEVDRMEWINAIEAVKSDLKKNRRLPTPPIMKKITFVCNGDGNQMKSSSPTSSIDQIDRIYEEPLPIYNLPQNNEKLVLILKEDSKNQSPEFYDTPKSPPKPVEKILTKNYKNEKEVTKQTQKESETVNATETFELLNTFEEECARSPSNSQKIRQSLVELADKIDFQAKVKDLHSKLSSQLLSPTSPCQERLQKKGLRKTYSNSSNDSSESMALTTSPSAKDQKKQKTITNKDTIPNKNSNGCNENQNNDTTEKPSKNWFLNRFQKTTSSMRGASHTTIPTFAKCPQSEKENLLNGADPGEQIETNSLIKNQSAVSMIINRLEARGGHKAMFGMEPIGGFNHNFCEKNDCNTYEPMTVSTPNKLLKKI